MNTQLLDKIDRFLLGEMDEEEKKLFEQETLIDPELRKEVERQQLLLESLYLHEEYIDLKKELATQVQPNKVYRKEKTRSKQKVITVISIAACVAALVSLSVYYASDFFGLTRNVNGNYALLSEEVRDLSTKQRSLQELVHDIVEKDNFNKQLVGTCFPITKDGFLVTSYHLIGKAKEISIELSDNEKYSASIVHKDRAHDLALLFINDTLFAGFNKLPYGVSKSIMLLGSDVYTLGYPKRTIVYNEGSVSSLSGYRDDSLSYQLSIPVNPGNSGAPVFNKYGNIVGVIHGKDTQDEGTSFAVKAEYLLEAAKNMPGYVKEIKGKIADRSSIGYKSRTTQIKSITPYILRLRVNN